MTATCTTTPTAEPFAAGDVLDLLIRPEGRQGRLPDAATLAWLVRGYDLDFLGLRASGEPGRAILSVRVPDGSVPGACRVRRLLKGLLRGQGVRCVALLPPGGPLPALPTDLDPAISEPPF